MVYYERIEILCRYRKIVYLKITSQSGSAQITLMNLLNFYDVI